MTIIEGGITAAKGFMASAAEANIKYSGRDDMALIYAPSGAASAGVYTSNVVKAAPVIYDRQITESDNKVYGIVINSGIANACTGEPGMEICRRTADYAASKLSAQTGRASGIKGDNILVASTGVIGFDMPMDRIKRGIDLLSEAADAGRAAANKAARAIMTTDTVEKEFAVSFEVGGRKAIIGGMCKGSGMIHPDMCTMLGFLATDVNISKELLNEALKEIVKDTFNMISVDGDTSTNDTLVILANGEAGNPKITTKNADYDTFKEALNYICASLAKKMAADGEGATKLFEVIVNGADTMDNARTLAKSVVTSSLTKAAIYGKDANWGRIFCALGYAGVDFDPVKVTLDFKSAAGSIRIAQDGRGTDYSEDEATRILSEDYVTALIDMNDGSKSATAWGCDLTHEYVSINADYRS